MHRGVEPVEVEVALERVDLAAEGVAPHGDVEPAEGLLAGGAVPIRSASRIIPAQVPNVGIPSAIRFRSGSNSSNVRASLAIVVDSPPGRTSPSQAASSAGRRTAIASTPRSVSTRRCSRTSPWRAKTPMVGEGTEVSLGDGVRRGETVLS